MDLQCRLAFPYHSLKRVSFFKDYVCKKKKVSFQLNLLKFSISTFILTSGGNHIYIILTNFIPVYTGTFKTSEQFLEAVTWVTSKHKALDGSRRTG